MDYKISVGAKEKVLHANMLKRYFRRSDSQPNSTTLAVSQGAYSCTEPDATAITDYPNLPSPDEQNIMPDPKVCPSSCFLATKSVPAPITAAVAVALIVTEDESDDQDDGRFRDICSSIPTQATTEGQTLDEILYDYAFGLPQQSRLRQLFQLYLDIIFLLLFLFYQSIL